MPGILTFGDLRVITHGEGASLIQHDQEIKLNPEQLRWLLVGAIPAVLAGHHPDRPTPNP